MLTNFFIKLSYTSLFPIQTKYNIKNKIYLKQLIIVLSIFYFFKFKLNSISHYYFKKNRKSVQILRSPYKNKKAQFQVGNNVFFLTVTFNFIFKQKVKYNNIFNYVLSLSYLLNNLETSLLYINNVKYNVKSNFSISKIY